MQWVRIRSWHLFGTWTRMPGVLITLCGRRADSPEMRDTLPEGKSCESCLRIHARKTDVG
jgi:hypothetical protein